MLRPTNRTHNETAINIFNTDFGAVLQCLRRTQQLTESFVPVNDQTFIGLQDNKIMPNEMTTEPLILLDY